MARGGAGVSKKARRRMYREMIRKLTIGELRRKRYKREKARKKLLREKSQETLKLLR